MGRGWGGVMSPKESRLSPSPPLPCPPPSRGRVLLLSPPRGALRSILKDDAVGPELVADAVGRGEVAVVLGLGAFGDPRLDRIGNCLRHAHEGSKPAVRALRH